MKDRLKFKVWDKEVSEWVRKCSLHYEVKDKYDLEKNVTMYSLELLMNNPDRFKVIQCIGRKDTDGKLIYEGDIVKEKRCGRVF